MTPSTRRRWLATLLLAPSLAPALASASTPAPANARPAAPPEVAAALPGASLQGRGRLRYLGLHVYDARLWSALPPGADWRSVPLALELEYARGLKGELIAERSLAEMRRQAAIDGDVAGRWLGAMKQAFPDVRAGDRLTGLMLPGSGARFFVNGRASAEVADAEFAQLFFGIWLSPQSSEPALREALLGRVGS